jgi:hypothetical protein
MRGWPDPGSVAPGFFAGAGAHRDGWHTDGSRAWTSARRFAIASEMRRTGLWLGVNACSVLFACGPTVAVDDGGAAVPDAPVRPIVPPAVDAGRPDVGAGSPPSLVISEVRSRGVGGGSDEFVELYNPSTDPVTLDVSWTLDGRSDTATSYSARWTGTGKIIPAHGHFLLTGSAYTQQPAADESLLTGITDATALRLSHAGVVVDALCYGFDATTLMVFVNDPTYVREGMPAMNAHDNTAGTNVDESIERKPGGTAGNGRDTNDNATDFAALTPSNPQDSASAPAP